MNRQVIKGRARELFKIKWHDKSDAIYWSHWFDSRCLQRSFEKAAASSLPILLICMSQGNVVSGLKMVTNRSNEVNDQML